MDGAEPAGGSSHAPLDPPGRAYLVQQLGPRPTEGELDSMDRAVGLACLRLAAVGEPIQLITTTYVTAQERWLALCLAESPETVQRAAVNAQLYGATVSEV